MHSAPPSPLPDPSPETGGALLPAPAAGSFVALTLAIGAAAVALVLQLVPPFEGTALVGYRDIGGVVTACTGNTSHARLGMRYTPQQCRELLASDLVRHARDLACVKPPPGRELAPHEKAAFLSLLFNVGPGRAGAKDGVCVLKSGAPSTIVQRTAAGDMAGACASISDWTGVKGRDCRVAASDCGGIVRRRAAERAMCEGRYLGAGAAPASAAAATA